MELNLTIDPNSFNAAMLSLIVDDLNSAQRELDDRTNSYRLAHRLNVMFLEHAVKNATSLIERLNEMIKAEKERNPSFYDK